MDDRDFRDELLTRTARMEESIKGLHDLLAAREKKAEERDKRLNHHSQRIRTLENFKAASMAGISVISTVAGSMWAYAKGWITLT